MYNIHILNLHEKRVKYWMRNCGKEIREINWRNLKFIHREISSIFAILVNICLTFATLESSLFLNKNSLSVVKGITALIFTASIYHKFKKKLLIAWRQIPECRRWTLSKTVKERRNKTKLWERRLKTNKAWCQQFSLSSCY